MTDIGPILRVKLELRRAREERMGQIMPVHLVAPWPDDLLVWAGARAHRQLTTDPTAPEHSLNLIRRVALFIDGCEVVRKTTLPSDVVSLLTPDCAPYHVFTLGDELECPQLRQLASRWNEKRTTSR